METLEIYRFGNKVGVNPPEGETFYLPIREARALAKAMAEMVEDIERVKFTASVLGHTKVEVDKDGRTTRKADADAT